MAEPFLGQIIMFGGNFAPRGWALCDGQLLPIAQNTSLFSILGTTYGGDGRTTFGLPDLRGRVAVHAGTGPGLPQVRLGEKGGVATHFQSVNTSVSETEALHTHEMVGETTGGGVASTSVATTADVTGASSSITPSNEENRPPFQTVNFIIALVGVFPTRN